MKIKFRAWDKKEKKMIYLDNVDYEGGHEYFTDDNFIPLQYTGLKDKNGKEIYEGDIVKWTNAKHYWEAIISTVKDSKSNTLYAVETFNNLSSDEEKNIYTYIRNNSRDGARNEIEFLDESIEIIGNIYENKELLNE